MMVLMSWCATRPRNTRVGTQRPELCAHRPFAGHDESIRRVLPVEQRLERLQHRESFLTRESPCVEQRRPLVAHVPRLAHRVRSPLGRESPGIDAPRPHRHALLCPALGAEPIAGVAGRDQHLPAGAVQPSHVGVHATGEHRRPGQETDVFGEIGVEAAYRRQAEAGRKVLRGQAHGTRRRDVDQADVVGGEVTAEATERRRVHPHLSVPGNGHAERGQRQIVWSIAAELRCRIDPRVDVVGQMPQHRTQGGRDAVGLVEVVVGEDGDSHHATPAAGDPAVSEWIFRNAPCGRGYSSFTRSPSDAEALRLGHRH